MNIYKFHSKPGILDYHAEAHDKVPFFIWQIYKNRPEELKKREHLLAKDLKITFWYAFLSLKKPFPAGEAAIAKSAEFAGAYAFHILKGPFPAGEAAIVKNQDGHMNMLVRCLSYLKLKLRNGVRTNEPLSTAF